MEKVFMIAIIITILFLGSKVVEMKYIDKEWKPMKFRSEEHTSELQSRFGSSYAVFCLKQQTT